MRRVYRGEPKLWRITSRVVSFLRRQTSVSRLERRRKRSWTPAFMFIRRRTANGNPRTLSFHRWARFAGKFLRYYRYLIGTRPTGSINYLAWKGNGLQIRSTVVVSPGMTLEPNTYTFITAANMIAKYVTKKENHRSVSGLGKACRDKVKTEFLPVNDWRALSVEQQATIRAAREKDPKIKKRSQGRKSGSDKSDFKI